MELETLEKFIEKYGLDGVIKRSTYKGDSCRFYFSIRERGYSEHLLAELYNRMMELYSDRKLRRLFMKMFMGGFELSTEYS